MEAVVVVVEASAVEVEVEASVNVRLAPTRSLWPTAVSRLFIEHAAAGPRPVDMYFRV